MRNSKRDFKWFFQKGVIVLGVPLVFYLSALLTLQLAFKGTNVCPIWIPSGIALAGFLFLGEYIFPGIWLGAFLLEITFFIHSPLSWPMILLASAAVAGGMFLEGVVASLLIKRFVKWDEFFNHIKHIPIFLAIAAFASAISATVGVAVLVLNHLTPFHLYHQLWLSWWFANVGGIFIITPCIIPFISKIRKLKYSPRRFEASVFFVLLGISHFIIFSPSSSISRAHMPVAFLIVPFVIWAAYRFSPRTYVVANLLIFIFTIWGTVNGGGPFISNEYDLKTSFILLQIFTIVVSISGMVFLALTAERKFAQQELERSHEHFKALVENSLEMIVLLNMEGIVLYSSPAVEKVLGYQKHEYEGRNIFELVHPDDISYGRQEFLNVLSHPRKNVDFKIRTKHKDGMWRMVEGSGKNLLLDSAIRAIVVNYRDVTERNNTEQLIQISEQRLRQIIDLVPNFIFAKDVLGRFVLVNQAIAEAYGTTIQDIIGKTDADFNKSKEEVEHFLKDDLEVIRSGEPKFIPEEVITDSKGHERYLTTIKIPFQEIGSDLPCVLGVAVDITERKKAEDMLKNELVQATRLADIGTLAAIVAHELRTPLGVIQMAAHNLKNKHKELANDHHIENIQKKVWEGDRIIDNLLSYSHIKMPILESFRILDLLDECVNNLSAQFYESNIVIEKAYKVQEDFMIEADSNQIREVLVNVLNNAYQSALATGENIVLEVQEQEQMIKVKVKDNGVGIDKEDLEKIFRPFFTTKSKGTGLGLTISNEIINLHRGRLEVQSSKGEGTEVTIVLPIKQIQFKVEKS